jgi:hypothetical protein
LRDLAAHGGEVYRVGGMRPRNAPGEEDSRSQNRAGVEIRDEIIRDR